MADDEHPEMRETLNAAFEQEKLFFRVGVGPDENFAES
jgi:hypothetical protein